MSRLFAFLVPLLAAGTCAAQGYTPVGRPKNQANATHFTFSLRGIPVKCQPKDIPTWNELKSKRFESHIQVMTGSQAAALNISFGGISGSYNADQLLAVSDSSRVAPCLATDGKTTVYYGEAIRTVVVMHDYTVKGGASIAVVAATATANGKSNSVDLYEIGFAEPKLDAMLVEAKHKLGGSGIQIENYSDFIKAFAAAESYAVGLTKPGIDIVAYEIPFSSADYKDMLASAWAIQKIAEGWGCEDAIKKFNEKGQQFENDIRNTYQNIAGGCGADGVAKAKAQALLNGLRIRY